MPRRTQVFPAFLLPILLILGACAGDGAERPATDSAPQSLETAAESPHDAFMGQLAALCGRAFRGEATLATSDAFAGEMIMHVRSCEAGEIQIPVHVQENRSRTWIITRTDAGLRLKHDHRHEDGTEEEQTQYGGDTVEPGTPLHQSFPADSFTAELIPEAETNVWAITITPGERLLYHLTRHGEPRATFVFDLTDEVPPPPAPWGYEEG